uniref:Probable threonine--tRNA ligase, cytoplasmic n=1 Tax=Vaucheria litorea TaxID=109269 RepID=H6WB86_VAULI|nr:threonyl-tRNA synthetase [Vaucheria litorea]
MVQQSNAEAVKINRTERFAVLDLSSSRVVHIAEEKCKPENHKTRLTKSSGKLVDDLKSGRIGGSFNLESNPHFIEERKEVYEQAMKKQISRQQTKPKVEITITLPDGSTKVGTSWLTTPMDIAQSISKQMAKKVIVAEVIYSRKIEDDEVDVVGADGLDIDEVNEGDRNEAELWDMMRPLIGDCRMRLLKWEDKEAKAVFWHSSAHYMGFAMECKYGCHLTHGPPIEQGFFYDCYMGDNVVSDKDFLNLNQTVMQECKKNQNFERLMLTKDEALDMFKYNPFKVQYIQTKIPDGSCTTVYKNGDFIDLCRGPHVPQSTMIQAFAATKTSATNWLAKTENDTLQRVYGVSFPEKSQLKKWIDFQEQAKLRDHRRLGMQQELFFFHPLSPGSAFFLPHGTRVYNKLLDFIRKEYRNRGYEEVTSPNIFNMELWNISGHALHYKENMFRFDVEGQEYGMKPMNCPGHCLMYAHRLRSYRELPLRLADFGVLHRNEISGALSGLTRVRRFCQDDAHIFCREDQITEEVKGALEFMKAVYDIFGMTYKLELSTKPEKALGDDSLWETAEKALAEALDGFAGSGNWRVNPGDGAFYGPKIDIKVFDAMERSHQCATIQLDFQLPIRFNLSYRGEAKAEEDGGNQAVVNSVNRPVMVHRAMLGSLERMMAVLTEHYGGRWPFWLSPRQAMVVPVGQAFIEYAYHVQKLFHENGFYVDIDDSAKTMNKKIREAEKAHYNYVLVVGAAEKETNEVNCREAGNKEVQAKNMKIEETIEMMKRLVAEYK